MMDAVTTILIVACPCILLLAATFTNGNVLSILGKNGLYLKNAFVIEKLAESNAIVFDKTGTITLNRSAAIRFVGDEIPSKFRQAIYSLASQSTHPLSLLIAASFKGIQTKPVTDFTDVTGAGLMGKADGFFVRIGSATFLGIKTENPFSDTRVYISVDGEILGYYSFDHALRPGLSSLVSKLKERFKLFLLSGDKESDKDRLSTYFSSDAMHFHQQPSDKLQFVANLQQQGNKVLMVGDGLNDAGALRQSDAGIAVSDDVNNFSPACDAILDGKVLPKLASMLQYCRDGKRVIAVSFALSLLYNVVGLYFSVRGELEPVIAAILMPITSISIVSFATITSSLLARRRGL
jgi:Cu+-exporting ATPase